MVLSKFNIMQVSKFFFLVSIIFLVQGCDHQTTDTKGEAIPSVDPKLRAIDSILAISSFKSRSIMINDTSMQIEMIIPNDQAQHFRRRGYIVDFSIYSIRSLINNVNHVKVREFIFNAETNKIKLFDSLNYDKSQLSVIKKWDQHDPLSFMLMSKMLEMNYGKYDELSSIGLFISDSLSQGEFEKDFYPDFTFFLDKYINELYGETEGTNYRKYMEYFYYYAHDKAKLNYLKPEDVEPFLNYGDINYYSKKYPIELEKIKSIRNNIPKEWLKNRL